MEKLKAFFQKIKDVIKLTADVISYAWNLLPKEVKVSIYLATSMALDQLALELELYKENIVNRVIAVAIINVLIVFVKNLPPRVNTLVKSLK